MVHIIMSDLGKLLPTNSSRKLLDVLQLQKNLSEPEPISLNALMIVQKQMTTQVHIFIKCMFGYVH